MRTEEAKGKETIDYLKILKPVAGGGGVTVGTCPAVLFTAVLTELQQRGTQMSDHFKWLQRADVGKDFSELQTRARADLAPKAKF